MSNRRCVRQRKRAGIPSILEDNNFEGVLAIVDRDFDLLEGTATYSDNILLTDLHDFECMMVASPAFAKVIEEYAMSSRVVDFEKRAGCDVATALATNAMELGYLRWVSLRESLDLDFEGITFGKFLDRTTLQVDTKKLLAEVKDNSQKHGLDDSYVEAGIESLRDDSHEPLHVACGHDLLDVLSFGLRRTIASRKEQEVNRAALEPVSASRTKQRFFEIPRFIKPFAIGKQPTPDT